MSKTQAWQFALIETDASAARRLQRGLAAAGLNLAIHYDNLDALEADLREETASKGLAQCEVVLFGLTRVTAQQLRLIRQLKRRAPQATLLGLVNAAELAVLLPAIQAGADGFLLRQAAPAELVARLSALLETESSLRTSAAVTVVELLREAGESALLLAPARYGLTERETEVLRCLVQGLSYQQAAARLGISLDTARSHLKVVYKKLGVHNAAQAVALALRQNLV